MLKKVLLSGILLSSITANEATLPSGKIKSLNAKYSTPKGSGIAQYINIENFGEFTKPSLEVDNANGLLIFSVDDKSFELDLSMLGISDAESINLNSLNFYNIAQDIKLNLAKVSATDTDFRINASSASISCVREVTHDNITDDLLDACLQNSTLRASHFTFWKSENEIASLVSEEVLGSDITVEDLKVSIKDGRLKAELKSNISKGIKITIEGNSDYRPEYRKVTLKVSKAKAGFINIKGKIFDELSKLKNEKIEVREPYIYIQLD